MAQKRNGYFTVVELREDEEISLDRENMREYAQAKASDEIGKRFALVRVLDVFEGVHIDTNVVHTIKDKRILLDQWELPDND